MTDDDVVRMFLYWKEPKGYRTDIDLSAAMYDENWEYKNHISFTNLSAAGCKHSGDIQSAPNGASEFIDIQKNVVINNGIRYVVFNIYSFTKQPFVELPECFAGIMGRQNPKSGEIYEPKTVKQKFDLTSNSSVAIPLIIDLYTNQVIWADLSTNGGRTIESNSRNTSIICSAISKMSDFKPNLYDLISLHAESRGEVVSSPEKADVVYDRDNIPFEIDMIMSEFLV
jgi:stress response protein SCP2